MNGLYFYVRIKGKEKHIYPSAFVGDVISLQKRPRFRFWKWLKRAA
jgi:hypothetical protein